MQNRLKQRADQIMKQQAVVRQMDQANQDTVLGQYQTNMYGQLDLMQQNTQDDSVSGGP